MILLQGMFLTQGLNSCLLSWKADSLPLNHQGGLCIRIHLFFFRFYSHIGYCRL